MAWKLGLLTGLLWLELGVGVANGGGTINDMYEPSQRAGIFGWYLLGPLLGPTLGPLLGGVIVTRLGWRWIYWVSSVA